MSHATVAPGGGGTPYDPELTTHVVVNSTLPASLSFAQIRLRRSGNIVFYEGRFTCVTGNFDTNIVGAGNSIPAQYIPSGSRVETASTKNGSMGYGRFGFDFETNGRVFAWFDANCAGQTLHASGSYFLD